MLDAQLRRILVKKLNRWRNLQAEMKEQRAFVEEANKKYNEVVYKMATHEASPRAFSRIVLSFLSKICVCQSVYYYFSIFFFLANFK